MNRRDSRTAGRGNSHATGRPQTRSDARLRAVYRVTVVGMFVNLLLVVGKFTAGVLGNSSAMIADAVHSVSDFVTDLIVIVFVGISARPRDESHRYGHGKFETLATVVIGGALAVVAAGILVGAVESIVAYARGAELPRPGMVALVAAAVSIAAKELLFRLTHRVGLREESPAAIANAWHHRSDALSSIGALVGIAGASLLGEQWRILDPVAAIAVGVLVGKAAVQMIGPGLNELLEGSLPADTEREIVEIVRAVGGVDDPHSLRTRRVGAVIAIDVHVRMDRELTVGASHRVTEEVERRLRSRFGSETLVTVHVEPSRRDG